MRVCLRVASTCVRVRVYVIPQLGNGGTADAHVPPAIPVLTNASAVAAGTDFTCAVTTTRSLRCWGWNGEGQGGAGAGASTTLLSPPPSPSSRRRWQ